MCSSQKLGTLFSVQQMLLCGWPQDAFDAPSELKKFPKLRTLTIEYSNLTRIPFEFPDMFNLQVGWSGGSGVLAVGVLNSTHHSFLFCRPSTYRGPVSRTSRRAHLSASTPCGYSICVGISLFKWRVHWSCHAPFSSSIWLAIRGTARAISSGCCCSRRRGVWWPIASKWFVSIGSTRSAPCCGSWTTKWWVGILIYIYTNSNPFPITSAAATGVPNTCGSAELQLPAASRSTQVPSTLHCQLFSSAVSPFAILSAREHNKLVHQW